MVHLKTEPYSVHFPNVIIRNTFIDLEDGGCQCEELRRLATAPARVDPTCCGSRVSSSTHSECSGSHHGDEDEESDDDALETPTLQAVPGPPTGLASQNSVDVSAPQSLPSGSAAPANLVVVPAVLPNGEESDDGAAVPGQPTGLERQNTFDSFEQDEDGDCGINRGCGMGSRTVGCDWGDAQVAAPQFLPSGSAEPVSLSMVPAMLPNGEVPTVGPSSDWSMQSSYGAMVPMPHQPQQIDQFEEMPPFLPLQQLPLPDAQALPPALMLSQQPQPLAPLGWMVSSELSQPSMMPTQQAPMQGLQTASSLPSPSAGFGPGMLIIGRAGAGSAIAVGTTPSRLEQDMLGPAPAHPAGGQQARLPQTLSKVRHPGSELIYWTIDAKKLNGSDRVAVSPPFELACGALQTFKMMISPNSGSDGKGGKGGASFRKAHGRGTVQVKCEAQVSESLGGSLEFYIHIGSGFSPQARWEQRRGPVTHNFARSGICGLPRELEEWDFKNVVDETSQTFVICLEVILHRAA